MAVRRISPFAYGLDSVPDGPADDTEEPYSPPKQENEQADDTQIQSGETQQVSRPMTFAQMQEQGLARPPMPTGPALTSGGASASLAPSDNNVLTPSNPVSPSSATVNDAFTVLYGDQADAKRKEAQAKGVAPTDADAWAGFTGTPEEVAAAKQRYNAYAGTQLDAEAEQEAIRGADAFAAGPGYFAGEEGLTAPDGAQSRLDYVNSFIRQARGPGSTASSSVVPTNQTPGITTPSNPSSASVTTDNTVREDQGNYGYNPSQSGGGFDILNFLINGVTGGGPGSDVQSATAAKFLEFLTNPNPYGAQEVKDSYSWLGGEIDDDYALQEKRLGEEMARRGLGQSTNYGGRLQDLNIGKRSAKTSLARDLASKYATSYGENVRGALGLGNTIGTTNQQNAQNWLQQLIGYGQQGFENDLATNLANEAAAARYQNWILSLLGYGSGG